MYVIFDTETNGLPKNYKASPFETDNWPRVIQLAWLVCDTDFRILDKQVHLIKPDGWEIPTEKFWIDNGFSQEKSLAEGVPLVDPLTRLLEWIDQCTHIVAHNMNFDYPVMAAEMIRHGMSSSNKPKKVCTMLSSTDYCKIRGPYGFKWPKLEELHTKLYGYGFEGAHDALNDVMACYNCLAAMINKNLIQL